MQSISVVRVKLKDLLIRGRCLAQLAGAMQLNRPLIILPGWQSLVRHRCCDQISPARKEVATRGGRLSGDETPATLAHGN